MLLIIAAIFFVLLGLHRIVNLYIAGERGVGGAQAVLDFYDSTVSLGIISVLCFLAGLFLLGLVTMRAGVLPRWAGILLSIGALLVFLGFVALDSLTLLGFLLMGAALVWIGYALWSSKGVTESLAA